MIVTCRSNRGADLPPNCTDPRAGIYGNTIFPLSIGKEYQVYALTIYLCHAWYYIINDDSFDYPVWAPAPLFDITNPEIPTGWHCTYHRFAHGEYPVISFPEWADDPTFYERLVDGDEAAKSIFDRQDSGSR